MDAPGQPHLQATTLLHAHLSSTRPSTPGLKNTLVRPSWYCPTRSPKRSSSARHTCGCRDTGISGVWP